MRISRAETAGSSMALSDMIQNMETMIQARI